MFQMTEDAENAKKCPLTRVNLKIFQKPFFAGKLIEMVKRSSLKMNQIGNFHGSI